MSQKNHRVLLGVSGGIAAYKSAELARLFIKAKYSVQVVMTAAACRFITPLTFQALTGKSVGVDLFDGQNAQAIDHIRLADETDLVVVAPATADLLAKAAHGFADSLLTTILLATKAPIVYAPAMNVNMWQNAATQDNVALLKKRGAQIIDPDSGELACGWEGAGRLAEPEKISAFVHQLLRG